jgi:integrase/recombinase XerD
LVRVSHTLPKILEPAEVRALLSALRAERDRAMVLAMLLGGLRRCEVLGLRLSDVRVGHRLVWAASNSPTGSGRARCFFGVPSVRAE